MIQRIDYLGRLAALREKTNLREGTGGAAPKTPSVSPVKVISGVRRCGKTTLLALYIDWLKRSGVDDNQIIFINLEEGENEPLLNFQALYSYIKKRLCAGRLTYVFVDDIHLCAHYEKAIDGLLINKLIDLYVSVSNTPVNCNAPYTEIRMLPLSFTEYLLFSKANSQNTGPLKANLQKQTQPKTGPLKTDSPKTERRLPREKAQMEKFLQREAFNEYLSFGGLPFAAALGGDAGLIRNYIDGIYNTILVKDVAHQAGINDIPLLELIARMMCRSTGRPLSSKKISTAIGAKGRKISTNTVETYMQALTAACVFYHAGRFDIKTGKHLKTLGKYYIADTGIRNLLLEQEAPDIGGQLENIVCLELLRRGFQVHIGKYGSDEINFVVSGDGKTAYFQVAATVRDPAILAQKLSSLERIRDNHPKYILSLDETPFRANYNGIIQQNLIEWLLEKKR